MTSILKATNKNISTSLLGFTSERTPILKGTEAGDIWQGSEVAFSPATVSAGNTTFCQWRPFHNQTARLEQMYLCFTATNTSATDTATFINPWQFISRFNVAIVGNNTELNVWDNDLTNTEICRIVGNELIKQDLERLDEQAIEFKDATTLAAVVSIAPGASYNFRLNLFYLIPQFRDFIVNNPAGPKFVSLRFKITMPASTGSTADCMIVRNATADAAILNKFTTYTNMMIYTHETIVRDPRLMEPLAPLFMFPRDSTQTRSVDFGTQYNSYTFTLSDILPPDRYWGISLLAWFPPTAYNAADALKSYGSSEILTLSYQRIGQSNTLLNLLGAANQHKRRQFFSWMREQRYGRKVQNANFGEVPLNNYFTMGLTLDFRLIERDVKDTLVSWIDIKKGLDRDYSITVQCLSALSASTTLYIVGHRFNPMSIDAAGNIQKSTALIGI